MSEKKEAGSPQENPNNTNINPPSRFKGLSQSPGVKFIIIGVITFMLLIPALLVWALVEERAGRADDVARSISQGWGNPQRINGPYLVVPYIVTEKRENAGSSNKDTTYVNVRRYAIYSPEQLTSKNDLTVEERKKAIYTTPLYHMKSEISGSFASIDTAPILSANGRPKLNEAFLAIEVSDLAGFRSEVSANINGTPNGVFKPGLNGVIASRQLVGGYQQYPTRANRGQAKGIHMPIKQDLLTEELRFSIKLAINGSRILEIVPSGKTTEVSMASNWPHPGFDGRFLPESRNISDAGFDAAWTIPNLARGISGLSLSSSMVETNSVIKVSFVKPLKFYQLVSRTLKYAVAFFALVFLAIFILEITGERSIHWIQYILTGLAMVVFYVLLLALAEHFGFTFAYLAAAIGTTALIGWYVGNALASRRASGLLITVLGLTYAIMYLILREDKYALLIGAIIAFAAIALTMYATRKVDWTKGAQKAA